MSYKITHCLEAQYKDEIGKDIYIGGFKDVLVIKIRAKIEDEHHFIKFNRGLERLINKHLGAINQSDTIKKKNEQL